MRRTVRIRSGLAGVAALVLAAGAAAQTVTLNGAMGPRALLVIDGKARAVSPGQTVDGVRLLRFDGREAEVEVEGKRSLLRLGQVQVNLVDAAKPRSLVLSAGPGGHFVTDGTINGRATRFLVDTGASVVTMSQAEAARLGVRLDDARRGLSQTANGPVPTMLITLGSVRLGETEVYNVEAAVLPAQMEFVLLGNSFLSRFDLKRDNDTLTLQRRY